MPRSLNDVNSAPGRCSQKPKNQHFLQGLVQRPSRDRPFDSLPFWLKLLHVVVAARVRSAVRHLDAQRAASCGSPVSKRSDGLARRRRWRRRRQQLAARGCRWCHGGQVRGRGISTKSSRTARYLGARLEEGAFHSVADHGTQARRSCATSIPALAAAASWPTARGHLETCSEGGGYKTWRWPWTDCQGSCCSEVGAHGVHRGGGR